MITPSRCRYALLGAPLLFALALAAQAQAAEDAGHGQNMAQMKFANFPGLPTCTTGSVQNGDPGKGPSIILAKAAKGCSFPWHWHTPSEHLMMVSGTAVMEAKSGETMTLKPGAFARTPSHHIHRFRCTSACALFIYADAAFDIHYVDAQEKELSPDDALAAVKEKAAK